jgi:Fic family protein
LVPGSEQNAWPALRDLAYLLALEAGALAGRLAPHTSEAVGDLVRGMNCYYSNLIEGHDTRPIDIERALRKDLAAEPERRNLQLEAAAHIAVQASIDAGDLDHLTAPSALMLEIHRRFYLGLPDALRFIKEYGSGRLVEVLPGELRTGHVEVGDHLAPPPEELTGWLARLDEGAPERFGRAERPVAVAALHHRLVWIHPFADGNGRTARLLSHALLRRAGVGSALWSVSRGLARNVGAYKVFLARADASPQGALDGRGILSDGRLAEFCRFFMAACVDQVRFMNALLAPEAISGRVREFVAAEAAGGRLDSRIAPLLERAVLFGQLERADVPSLLGTSDRHARRLVSKLVERGLLAGAKDSPLQIAFPLGETERLFPNLWAPSGVAQATNQSPEVEAALRIP